MYPSFGKKKSKYSDKDKAAKNLNIFLNDFIREKFIYPNYALENNIQGKTLISFVINKEGDVRSIISYSGHPILQLQSIKMFETLPKFNPGERNNKSVNVKFTMPITYRLQN
jgi:TonB family protein